MDALHAIINDPKYHDYLAILKGARNGAVYGAKVRFPHALVMAILFGRGECVPCSLCCSIGLTNLAKLAGPRKDHREGDEDARNQPCQIRCDIQVFAPLATQSQRRQAA
jgi:hypothetical protein